MARASSLNIPDTPNDEQKNKKLCLSGRNRRKLCAEIEVGNALETSGKLKKRKIIPHIEAVLFGLLGLFSLLSIIFSYAGLFRNGQNKPQLSHYLVTVVCFLYGAGSIYSSRIGKKKKIHPRRHNRQRGQPKIFDNVLEVCVLGNGTRAGSLSLTAITA